MKRLLLAALVFSGIATGSFAGIVRSGFDASSMGRNDDSSSDRRPLGFSNAINFGGANYTSLYVNNNGNVTFDGALSAFTPFGIATLNRAIIAPFFADVDTRNALSGIAAYGTGTVDGFQAFGVTWKDVGYYDRKADKKNTFQLVLINRPDTGPGNFDIEFNYDKIQWEAGEASRGAGGLGGTTAGIGFANSPGALTVQVPGSGLAGAFLDSNLTTGLLHSSNVGIDGRFLYSIRNAPVAAAPIPEPTTVVFGLALIAACACGRPRAARR